MFLIKTIKGFNLRSLFVARGYEASTYFRCSCSSRLACGGQVDSLKLYLLTGCFVKGFRWTRRGTAILGSATVELNLVDVFDANL